MIVAVIGFSGMFLYAIAALLGCAWKKTRKIGLVLMFPALAMMGVPFVAVYGLYTLVPYAGILLVAVWMVRRIWND